MPSSAGSGAHPTWNPPIASAAGPIALSDTGTIALAYTSSIVSAHLIAIGDPVAVRRLSNGAPVKQIDTHHYRPACLDYKL